MHDKAPTTTSIQMTEQSAWHAKASDYDDFLGSVTRQAVDTLLDAAEVAHGKSVLDVAAGPGYAAGAAVARGANAIGVDFAAGMVNEATRRFPDAEFYEGNGTALGFDDATFDAVICSFGLMLMPEPEQAVGEAYRVLKRSGRYAYSVWDPADTQEFFGLVVAAIQAHGDTEVLAPSTSPTFRFSDHDKCRAILAGAGFKDITLAGIKLVWTPDSTEQLLSMIYNSTVRTAALLEHQAPDELEEIHNAILKSAEDYRCADGFSFVWPVVVVCGLKA